MNFNHHDLATCAVTPDLSLLVPPIVKPVVVGTPEQIATLEIDETEKKIHHANGKAYVIDRQAACALVGSIAEAKRLLDLGDDSALLGYPPIGPKTLAVTRRGNILSVPEVIWRQAVIGNVIWAAEGEPEAVEAKARLVSLAVKKEQSDEEGLLAVSDDVCVCPVPGVPVWAGYHSRGSGIPDHRPGRKVPGSVDCDCSVGPGCSLSVLYCEPDADG
jgi:hypothetical protein